MGMSYPDVTIRLSPRDAGREKLLNEAAERLIDKALDVPGYMREDVIDALHVVEQEIYALPVHNLRRALEDLWGLA